MHGPWSESCSVEEDEKRTREARLKPAAPAAWETPGCCRSRGELNWLLRVDHGTDPDGQSVSLMVILLDWANVGRTLHLRTLDGSVVDNYAGP